MALAQRFVPPRRFGEVSFDNYRPDAQHPSQQAVRDRLQQLVADMHKPGRSPSRWWRRSRISGSESKDGLYLDGGFGVGKTHLLAALWHRAPGPKAYLSFEELTAFVGLVGMPSAVAAFSPHRVICIDEFELDDVANTLMVVTLLRALLGNGLKLVVTSNTLPERLGEKRFSAADFRREIAAIASHFDEVRIDGPDYRSHVDPPPLVRHDAVAETVTYDDFPVLLEHLRQVHPVQYGAMLDDLDGIVIENVTTIPHQPEALLFVQFVDELYNARLPVHLRGDGLSQLFAAHYRHGGYALKYGRAESRIAAMQQESAGIL